MIKFILQKIKNKLWLTVCLMLGLIFLVAAFSCQPMFKSGSLDMLLKQKFEQYIEDNNSYPAVFIREGTYNTDSVQNASEMEKNTADYQAIWSKYLNYIGVINSQTLYKLPRDTTQGGYGSKGNYISVSYMPDMLSHVSVLKGTDYDDADNSGYYPCMLSESVMDRFGLIVGETIDYVQWKDSENNTLKLIIVGIFREKESTDSYWYITPNSLENEVFVSDDVFDEIISRYSVKTVEYKHATILDYKDIDNSNYDEVMYYIEQFKEQDKNFSETVTDITTSFSNDRKSVNVMLWVLELPIMGLVLAFIYMVSCQITESEKNEIAMLKSRGISRGEVVLMYLLQSGVLAALGTLIGVPLGVLLCRISSCTTDFLTFDTGGFDSYGFVWSMLIYGLAASVIGIIFIIIPVIRYSNVTIVEHKSSYNKGGKMFWEKYFIDIILLAVSLYMLFNFNKSTDQIREKALAGSKLDPMIFLDTTLFIISFGLVVLRLIHYLVKLIYRIGKNRWKPAFYASFLQITRTFGKQGFISVFMILTVSMGLFNANAARTINKNHEDRIVYEDGADVVLEEKWDKTPYQDSNYQVRYRYEEADYMKYEELVDIGLADSTAKVLRYEGTDASAKGAVVKDCTVMGVETKAFGETAYLKEELYGDYHWYNWLNELGKSADNIIISSNLASELQVEVGGVVSFYGMLDDSVDEEKLMMGHVCAVVDSWPGYDRYYYDGEGNLKERYLIVANYSKMASSFDLTPYEVWIKLADGVTAQELYDKIDGQGIKLSSYKSVSDDVYDMKNSPELRITNGMFTLSFIIAIVLCGVGFLIYWISSIRQREMIFGVYRAMGMSVKNINQMLINEHIFSTLLTVTAGGLVGMATTLLFVRLFGVVYLPEKHNLDIYIYYEAGDIGKLFFVIAVMIILCMLILRRIVRSLNITQALKLGEE